MDSEVQVTEFIGYQGATNPAYDTKSSSKETNAEYCFNSVFNMLLSTCSHYFLLDSHLKSCFTGVLTQVKFIRGTFGGIRYQHKG